MKHLKRRICDVEFDVLSPCYYSRGTLQIVYLGFEFGWRLIDADYTDPTPYKAKEDAVMRYVYAMQQ